MPPVQGEVSLLTLFADVHYYFSPPTQKPPHHRFDKSSYVYLYHNPIQQSGRIEIANHAGTPDQDAFAGSLDTVKIEQSYKHPCLFSLTVDAFRSRGGSAAPSPQQDMSQWHLPSPDPRGDGKYMYRIHTVDLYFWTPDDAGLFLDSLKRVAQPHQLQIVANPHAAIEHKTDVMNPVVAKLEKAAISQSTPSPSQSNSFPGPPPAPAPAPSTSPPASTFTPIPYNPAAPAAPEPIAPREKTPPPPDAADGTGLNAAAHHDQQGQQYQNPLQASFTPQPTSGPYIPGPLSRAQTFSGPPTPGIQRAPTSISVSLPPPPQSPPAFAPPPTAPPPTQQYANYAAANPGHAQPLQSPSFGPSAAHHTPLPSPGFPPQQYQPLASPPPGGYAQYQYGSTTQQVPGTDPYATHQQVYRPTEQEASVEAGNEAPEKPRNSNIGRRAEKVEKGVGKLLKKLDKKF
ncbi:uncharacterized protein EI97DRAFT_435857 [Westerdykella ornata]|uniref:Uncharacterized protein n=1 Tax=Westerdykella ornata TaxID=318751 RepID=A0A6A6JBP8_WESOR|nr:uncharacterized protein EI97DRAFT_435857 [Westerdykella ornata]KAF2273687.1 hypothetical protein EI97DRAFT_435857 [Westerdykella ornata]